jgi:two-component system chemotaxis response regulator CheB
VDDNGFFRRMLCERFEREEEFQICGEAENGKEAVEKAIKLKPDLIVLDLVMPVMNGLDAARVLRLLMPRLPLIMNSAMVDQLAEQQARTIGVAEIAPKSAEKLIGHARRMLYSPEQVAA